MKTIWTNKRQTTNGGHTIRDKTIGQRMRDRGHTRTNDLFKFLVAVMDTKWGAVSPPLKRWSQTHHSHSIEKGSLFGSTFLKDGIGGSFV